MSNVTITFKYIFPDEYGGDPTDQNMFVNPVSFSKPLLKDDTIARGFAAHLCSFDRGSMIPIGASLWASERHDVTVDVKWLPKMLEAVDKYYSNEDWKLEIMKKIFKEAHYDNEKDK